MGDHRPSYRSRSRASTHWETTDGTPQKGDQGQVTPKGSPVTNAPWIGDHRSETSDGETAAPASDFGARQALTGSPQSDALRIGDHRWETTDGDHKSQPPISELDNHSMY